MNSTNTQFLSPITRVTDKSSLSALKEEIFGDNIFCFCMAVSAIENNNECREHNFFCATCDPSSGQKFPVTSINLIDFFCVCMCVCVIYTPIF